MEGHQCLLGERAFLRWRCEGGLTIVVMAWVGE